MKTLWQPTRGIWVPKRGVDWRSEAGFISIPTIGAIAGSRRRSAGGGPTYGANIANRSVYNNTNPMVLSLSPGASAGTRVVVVAVFWTPTLVMSSVTDTKGNTYTQDASNLDAFGNLYVYSSVISSALVAGTDTISVATTVGSTAVRFTSVFTLDGSTGADVTGTGIGTSGTTETATASTTVANTVAFGVRRAYSGTVGFTPGTGWTAVNNSPTEGAMYQTFSTSGSKTTGGTWTTSSRWGSLWVAYK